MRILISLGHWKWKCVDYVENMLVLKILTYEHFCWNSWNDCRPFSVLDYSFTFDEYNVDMKLIHISTIALSCIVEVEKSRRSSEIFAKNQNFPTSFNCPACGIVCERVNWKSGTNYFYFRCRNCHLERSIREGFK